MDRRRFLSTSLTAAGGILLPRRSGAQAAPPPGRPLAAQGVQSGDLAPGQAMIWSRTDRPARMWVEWATNEQFSNARRVSGPAALEHTDFTAKLDLRNLPGGQQLFYRVQFQDLTDLRNLSEPVAGRLRTPPVDRRDVSFVWGGDTVGQGWGIDPSRGGMLTYDSMRKLNPDFFLHSGDTIYADNPLQAEVKLDDGSVWKNLVTPEKSKVAETLDEFRGNHRYNLLDEHLRRLNSEVPNIVQWDDHEVRNNWFPGMVVDDARYRVKSADLLAARGRQAFLDYYPLRPSPADPERIYRSLPYGPLLELFMLDERSYRGRNTANRQEKPDADTVFLGSAQMAWIKSRLLASKSTWKVIASDMPLGLLVRDPNGFEAWANGNGPALGRELELAELLKFIKERNIRNVVWLTADVHYAAAHHYDPARARYTEFNPFWEFVAGPLHAGNFGPGELDDTFGPEVRFHTAKSVKGNRPPSEGHQYFGAVKIDGKSGGMRVSLHNREGKEVYHLDLAPEGV